MVIKQLHIIRSFVDFHWHRSIPDKLMKSWREKTFRRYTDRKGRKRSLSLPLNYGTLANYTIFTCLGNTWRSWDKEAPNELRIILETAFVPSSFEERI